MNPDHQSVVGARTFLWRVKILSHGYPFIHPQFNQTKIIFFVYPENGYGFCRFHQECDTVLLDTVKSENFIGIVLCSCADIPLVL